MNNTQNPHSNDREHTEQAYNRYPITVMASKVHRDILIRLRAKANVISNPIATLVIDQHFEILAVVPEQSQLPVYSPNHKPFDA
jgi:hypothetical protein